MFFFCQFLTFKDVSWGFLMHLRPFSVKKKSDFSDFFPISPILYFFWQIVDFQRCFVGFLMHFRPFSVKRKSYFFQISPIFEIYWPIFFFDDLLNIGLLPHPKTLDSPRVLHCPLSFNIKKDKKSGKKNILLKNRISDAAPQKRISDS